MNEFILLMTIILGDGRSQTFQNDKPITGLDHCINFGVALANQVVEIDHQAKVVIECVPKEGLKS